MMATGVARGLGSAGSVSATLAVVLAAALTAGCDLLVAAGGQSFREDKRFTVAGTPEVELSTFDGSIEVRTGSASDVLVTIERRASSEADAKTLEVAAEQSGNRISVRVTSPHRAFQWGRSLSANLIVTVPAASNLDARSGDGSVRVDGVTGSVKVHTGDGSIKLSNVTGAVDVSSGDGSIAVGGRLATLRAWSGDGSVTIDAAPGSAVADGWDVTTGDGSVDLRLPDGFNASLDAHTGDGGIHMNDVAVSNVTGRIGRDSVRGTLGSGGGPLRVRTGDGSITLRK